MRYFPQFKGVNNSQLVRYTCMLRKRMNNNRQMQQYAATTNTTDSDRVNMNANVMPLNIQNKT